MAAIGAATAFAVTLNAAPVAAAEDVTLYKNPQCGCCEACADYLRENGLEIDVKPTHEPAKTSRAGQHPRGRSRRHTAFFGDYVVSGHVPIEVVNRMLEEKPEIDGITMPQGIIEIAHGNVEEPLNLRRVKIERQHQFGSPIRPACWRPAWQ